MEPSECDKAEFEFAPTILDSIDRNDIINQSSNEREIEPESTCVSRSVEKEDLEVIFSSNTIPDIEYFCRVCGSEVSNKNLIFIFGKHGNDLLLEKKIFDYLHLEVKENDHLPQQVCPACVSHLNTFHQFFNTSQTAAFKLRQLFLPNKLNEEEKPIESEKIEVLSTLDPHLIDSNEEALEMCITDSLRNVSKDKKTLKARKKEKLQTPVLCHICGKAFKDMTNLHSHKRTHLPEDLKKKYQCSMCMKSFRTNFHLSEHMNVHLGVTPYGCPDCDKRFHSRALLRQHTQVHRARADDRNKVVCPKCGLMCSRKGNLRAHLKTHAEDRSFVCRLCQRQFASYSEMLSHRRRHGQHDIRLLLQQDLIKDKDINTCQYCDKIFTNKRTLTMHVERVHDDAAVKHECGECGKQLHSRRSLVYHRRSQHTSERPHRCSICGEGFLLPKLLRAHEAKHTGERPFKCDVCGKGFRSQNNLHQHSQKHDSGRKFTCTVCGKNFQRRAALVVHNRIHSGEKPFVCDVCGRGFSQKNDLLKHQKTHVEGNSKTRTCEQCVMVFGSKKGLLKHKETVHRDKISVVPLIITNSLYETHVITEDGQNLVFPTVDGHLEQNNLVISNVTELQLV